MIYHALAVNLEMSALHYIAGLDDCQAKDFNSCSTDITSHPDNRADPKSLSQSHNHESAVEPDPLIILLYYLFMQAVQEIYTKNDSIYLI